MEKKFKSGCPKKEILNMVEFMSMCLSKRYHSSVSDHGEYLAKILQ